MKYLICYDITNDELRDEIAKYLETFATRLQYSVFVCDLSPARSNAVWLKLSTMAAPEVEKDVGGRRSKTQTVLGQGRRRKGD